jgi:hypothetical protein
MPINASWHRTHRMPKNPSDAERVAWHREHERHCACRPVPPKLRALMAQVAAGPVRGGQARLEDCFLQRDAVRRLVRDTLGCDCPEEVFDDVQVAFPARLARQAVRGSVKIVVGGRLLVVLVPADSLAEVERDALSLLARGRAARDACGLNRFRLVLVGTVPVKVLRRLRTEARRLDDRTHAHAIAAAQLRSRGQR